MSNTKTVMGQAANTQGIPLDIPDVFSTYLYTGTGANRTITNGLDLSGQGGLVWIKSRSDSRNNLLFDTERGANYYLRSNTTDGTLENADTLSSFNSDGFNIGSTADVNRSTATLASWTWRKAPKFFDVQTWAGSGVAGRTVSHNLGVAPGMIILKCTSNSTNWMVYHRGADATAPEDKYLMLNMTNAVNDSNIAWNDTAPTLTEFTLGSHALVNATGQTYIAYIFAHNDGDGEFGPSGNQDIIKCGSYTGTGNTGNPINLGFEPQWIMVKRTNSTGDWIMYDVMRGLSVTANGVAGSRSIPANSSDPETNGVTFYPTSTGFYVYGTNGNHNASGSEYIYMAIRRGPLYPPTAGTEVFAVATGNEVTASKYNYHSGFPVDMAWRSVNTNERAYIADRLRGPEDLWSDSNRAEVNNTSSKFDDNVSWYSSVSTNTNAYSWMFRRAPSFFDVVAYTGSGVAGRTVSHNLGVAPEMMWVKERDNATNWNVYHTGLNGGTTPQDYFIRLNLSNAEIDNNTLWNDTAPTDTQFTVGLASDINGSNDTYIAYLFATLAGISKVGSFTGNGSSQTIDCGFTSGASFILVKRTNSSGSWRYFDSKRGIVAGNDTSSKFNGSDAYVTNVDEVDPHNSGFIINQTSTSDLNVSNATYIFYAIA